MRASSSQSEVLGTCGRTTLGYPMGTEPEPSLPAQELRGSRGIMEGIPWDTGFESDSVVGKGQWDVLIGERDFPGGVPPWHRTPTPTHRSWQAGPKPSSFSPWQGLAASVRLMKPSGCDTISSKLGREPLPVPVREGGRVPINKTILESRRKGLFCSHPSPPYASQRFIFISVRAPDRPRLHKGHNCTL